jgi:hypothetical protein
MSTTEATLKEEDQALSCSLLSRFSENIFIELNKLFILACNFDVLFQEDDMISKLNEKKTAKRVAKRITKRVAKRIKKSLIFQASLSLKFEDQCKSCVTVDL